MTKHRPRSTIASLLCFAGLAISTTFAQPAATPPASDPAAAGMTVPGGQTRASPHAITSEYIGGDRRTGTLITIIYGRPYTIKPGTTLVRKIWGGQGSLVPWDKADRLGAD